MKPTPLPSKGWFCRFEATTELPEPLRRNLPSILWLSRRPSPPATVSGRVVIRARPLGETDSPDQPVVVIEPGGQIRVLFDIEGAINATLLEQYHDGLIPTSEMRLPFNYSKLPNALKGLGSFLRLKQMEGKPPIPFPSEETGAVVDWLCDLMDWAGLRNTSRSIRKPWPVGKKGALIVTHDVDTDWVFRHPEWLERICNMEEKYGLRGAWYCVPAYSESKAAERGMETLLKRGCEVGCHGYNHDAKWPITRGAEYEKRLRKVEQFARRWGARGFRSEWLWRTPQFLQSLASVFDYDSSVPTASFRFTRATGNGCATFLPYLTTGDLLELPVTLPMDQDRIAGGTDVVTFWKEQVVRARRILARGGLVVISLHPQPHQAANEKTLREVDRALAEITSIPDTFFARPDEIHDWFYPKSRAAVGDQA